MDFTSKQFAGQFVDQEDVAPDELRAAVIAMEPQDEIITLKTSPTTGDMKSWLLLARAAADGLIVVTGSGDDWTMTSTSRPGDAVMAADWYPLDAVERVGLEVSDIARISEIDDKHSHETTWHIYLRGRVGPLTLDHEPTGRKGIVDAFVRRLRNDRSGAPGAEEHQRP